LAQSVAPRARLPGLVPSSLIAENDLQEAKMTRPPSEGGDGLDGMWNDDFHHGAIVAMTGNNVGYYSDYSGNPQEFISAAKYGFLYQGTGVFRGGKSCAGLRRRVFPRRISSVLSKTTTRSLTPASVNGRVFSKLRGDAYRAMTALLLLGPWTPLLFQGEEFGASSPFLYFADVGDESVRDATRRGRAQCFAPFLTLTRRRQ